MLKKLLAFLCRPVLTIPAPPPRPVHYYQPEVPLTTDQEYDSRDR